MVVSFLCFLEFFILHQDFAHFRLKLKSMASTSHSDCYLDRVYTRIMSYGSMSTEKGLWGNKLIYKRYLVCKSSFKREQAQIYKSRVRFERSILTMGALISAFLVFSQGVLAASEHLRLQEFSGTHVLRGNCSTTHPHPNVRLMSFWKSKSADRKKQRFRIIKKIMENKGNIQRASWLSGSCG